MIYSNITLFSNRSDKWVISERHFKLVQAGSLPVSVMSYVMDRQQTDRYERIVSWFYRFLKPHFDITDIIYSLGYSEVLCWATIRGIFSDHYADYWTTATGSAMSTSSIELNRRTSETYT